jgi:S1-C subfamily serine protease
MANEFGLPNTNGVMILTVSPEGGAHDAGLSEGDVIKSINGHAVNSSAELQELISLYHPGDTVKVVYLRNKLEKTAEVLLRMP